MTFTAEQVETIGELLDLPAEAVTLVQVVSYKGSLPSAIPTDPLIYRFYELIMVYGTTIKDLQGFGDGIMSAINYQSAARSQGGSGLDRHEREILALQDVLS